MKRRTIVKTTLIVGLLALVSLGLIIGCGLGSQQYYREKYSPVEVDSTPINEPGSIIVQEQTEGHTCGYHALSSIYQAHGLDPQTMNLRFRLGVDKPAVPFDNETLGSIHPDIYRVGRQDGFVLTALEPDVEESKTKLCQHGDRGLYTLTLIRRKENGNLHWIVLGRCHGGAVDVYDSLYPEPYQENIDDYFQNNILSLITVEPSQDTQSTVTSSHMDGIEEMNRVRKRISSKED